MQELSSRQISEVSGGFILTDILVGAGTGALLGLMLAIAGEKAHFPLNDSVRDMARVAFTMTGAIIGASVILVGV